MFETINPVMPIGTQLVMDHAIPAGDRGLLTLICVGLMLFILLRAAVGMVRAGPDWSCRRSSTCNGNQVCLPTCCACRSVTLNGASW